jgi:hypothetical protein
MNELEEIINNSSIYKIHKFCKKNQATHYITKILEPDKLLFVKIRSGLNTWYNLNFDGVEIFIFNEYSKVFIHTKDEFNEKQIVTQSILSKYKNSIDIINTDIFNKIDIYFNKYKIDYNLKLDENITTLENSIECTICKIIKSENKFQNGYYSQCIKCRSIYKRNLESRTKETFLQQLLHTAKHNSKHRSKTREIAGTFDITLQDLLDIYNSQNGLCYYSKVKLNLNFKSDWQCSIERLNPDIGYIKENVALIALEFNTASQMSAEKFTELIKLLNINHQPNLQDFYKKEIKYIKSKRDIQIIDNIELCKCSKCETYKNITCFRNNRIICKECNLKYDKMYRNTPRGNLIGLLSGITASSKQRGHNLPEFTFDDLVELFNKQNGLCFYSGIPMSFGSYKDISWTISAERLDNSIGYTKENVVLVCWEFNVPHTQWSKEKVQLIKNTKGN